MGCGSSSKNAAVEAQKGATADVSPAVSNAVKNIQQAALEELMDFIKPPPIVLPVAQAMCILLSIKPVNGDYWGPFRAAANTHGKFTQTLAAFDADGVAQKKIDAVSQMASAGQLDVDVINRASIAAVQLCKWIHAVLEYRAGGGGAEAAKAVPVVAAASPAISNAANNI